MKNINHFHKTRHKGFTMAELSIAMVLMSFVVFLAGALVKLASVGFVSSETQMSIVREQSNFASILNEQIKESTVAFTVPRGSFNNRDKLTAGWNYLGLMDNVRIPKAVSRTGEVIDAAQALVYIEFAGNTAPSSVPDDCNLITNAEGYFIQRVLGYAFTDAVGVTHSYTLVFKPTKPNDTAAQTIVYEFSADVTDAAGNTLGDDGTTLNIDSMLTCLNSIQVVYKGSATNPAVALAFRGDFMPTWSASQASTGKPPATVVMVLDLSSSMNARFSGTTRVQALRDTAADFVRSFSTNERINVMVIPFSNVAYLPSLFKNNRLPSKWVFNANRDYAELQETISGLQYLNMTNPGDGLRVAHVFLNRLRNTDTDMGQVFLILMTDGLINVATKVNNRLYYGDAILTSQNAYGYTWTQTARDYTEYWGLKIVSDFDSKNYLINLSDGMGYEDKTMLERVFGTSAMDVNSLTDFQTVWEEIGTNMEEVMWAFEGPNL